MSKPAVDPTPLPSVAANDQPEQNVRTAGRAEIEAGIAESMHRQHDAMHTASGQLTGTLGVQAIKAPGFAAAASAVALLGIVSTNLDQAQLLLAYIQPTLTWLMVVILISTVAHGGAYLSQFFIYEALDRRRKIADHPYVVEGPGGEARMWIGRMLHFMTIALVVASYVALVLAGSAGLGLINWMMTGPTVSLVPAG